MENLHSPRRTTEDIGLELDIEHGSIKAWALDNNLVLLMTNVRNAQRSL